MSWIDDVGTEMRGQVDGTRDVPGSFVRVDEGEYNVQLVSFKKEESDDNGLKITFEYKVLDGEFENATFRDKFYPGNFDTTQKFRKPQLAKILNEMEIDPQSLSDADGRKAIGEAGIRCVCRVKYNTNGDKTYTNVIMIECGTPFSGSATTDLEAMSPQEVLDYAKKEFPDDLKRLNKKLKSDGKKLNKKLVVKMIENLEDDDELDASIIDDLED